MEELSEVHEGQEDPISVRQSSDRMLRGSDGAGDVDVDDPPTDALNGEPRTAFSFSLSCAVAGCGCGPMLPPQECSGSVSGASSAVRPENDGQGAPAMASPRRRGLSPEPLLDIPGEWVGIAADLDTKGAQQAVMRSTMKMTSISQAKADGGRSSYIGQAQHAARACSTGIPSSTSSEYQQPTRSPSTSFGSAVSMPQHSRGSGEAESIKAGDGAHQPTRTGHGADQPLKIGDGANQPTKTCDCCLHLDPRMTDSVKVAGRSLTLGFGNRVSGSAHVMYDNAACRRRSGFNFPTRSAATCSPVAIHASPPENLRAVDEHCPANASISDGILGSLAFDVEMADVNRSAGVLADDTGSASAGGGVGSAAERPELRCRRNSGDREHGGSSQQCVDTSYRLSEAGRREASPASGVVQASNVADAGLQATYAHGPSRLAEQSASSSALGLSALVPDTEKRPPTDGDDKIRECLEAQPSRSIQVSNAFERETPLQDSSAPARHGAEIISDEESVSTDEEIENNMGEAAPTSSDGGCEHYRRNCVIIAPCCGKEFPCRRCHDQKEDHKIVRKNIARVRCIRCMHVQPAKKRCEKCDIEFAAYFCDRCKLYDNDTTKSVYHCEDCDVCRLGTRLENYHCGKCGTCVPMSSKDTHPCMNEALDRNCPICTEMMSNSCERVVLMKCGHAIHAACFRDHTKHSYVCPICYKSLTDMTKWYDEISLRLAQEEPPPERASKKSRILCNDCESKSEAEFHYQYHRCGQCSGYNTRVLEYIPITKPLGSNSDDCSRATASTANPGAPAADSVTTAPAIDPHRQTESGG